MHLGRLASYRVDRDNVATPDQNASFSYDASGRVTSIADVPEAGNPGRSDRQCFRYTWAGELSEAWANGDASCAGSPVLSGSGAAPYWTSWTYDGHRRKTQTQHRAAGADVVDTYSYPAVGAVPDGTTGGFHAASRVDRTGGTPAVSAFTYDRSGGTTSTPLPAGGTGTITYDEQGRTRAVTAQGAAAGTTYVYDADGGLLIRRDPSGRKTLYLGDTEVTYTPANGGTPASTSAVRVFTFEGQVVALRTGTGPGGIVFQPPGYQGTALTWSREAS
ncbi:MAG: hypothetical protein ACRCYU_09975 [Nocardioides sp.]